MSKTTNTMIVAGALSIFGLSANANIMGTVTGAVFEDPTPTCPPATCTVAGTSVSWGVPLQGSFRSLLTFTATPFNTPVTAPRTPSAVGDLLFRNGEIVADTGINGITLAFNSGSITAQPGDVIDLAAISNKPIEIGFALTNTPNITGTDEGDADFIEILRFQVGEINFGKEDLFRLNPDLVDRFHVFEGEQTTADIELKFNSIILQGFANVLDPTKGFVTSSVATVSEPAIVALMSVGLIALIRFTRRTDT